MKQDYEALKADALSSLTAFLDSLDEKRRSLLAYWIRDYVRFLAKEETFDPQKLVRYKRGSIVKAHLGYRIGSEEGGLHYAVVVDTKNAQKAQTATIIPLTSVKPTTDLDRLHPSRVYLGDEIYQKLSSKLDSAISEAESIQTVLIAKLKELTDNEVEASSPDARMLSAERRVSINLIRKEMKSWKQVSQNAKKMDEEISKMKRGSIALVSQITTISKIRIYDPLYPADALFNIRLSDEALDKLDEKIIELYTRKK